MVKKVEGKRGLTGIKSDAVKSTTAATQVGATKSVGAASSAQGAGKIRRATRPMTSAEREHLMQLIKEEADKMFGANGLPESQRHTVEKAVRMAIDASILDDEESDI